MGATDTYLQNNRKSAARYSGAGQSAVPSKKIAIVTCMDARIDIFEALGLENGEAHVIRNAGGLATDDVLRSLAISQAALETREIMVIQHTGCGLLLPDDAPLAERIRAAAGAAPTFELGTFSDPEAEVRRSLATLRKCPFLAHRDSIRGFVFDVETGRLAEVSD